MENWVRRHYTLRRGDQKCFKGFRYADWVSGGVRGNKQYLEKRRVIEEKVKNIRAKGENSQLPWKEVNEFEHGGYNGFVVISNKRPKVTRIWKRGLKIKNRSSEIPKKILKNGMKRIKKRLISVKN